MTVKNKLILGIGFILLIFGISTSISIHEITDIKDISKTTGEESVPFAILAADTKFLSCQIQQFATDSSLTQDKEVLKEAKDAYNVFNANLNKFEEMFKKENDMESLDTVTQAKIVSKELLEISIKMFEGYSKDKEQGNLIMKELDVKSVALAKLIDKLKEEQITEAITNSKDTISKSENTLFTSILLAIIGMVVGIIVGIILTTQITNLTFAHKT